MTSSMTCKTANVFDAYNLSIQSRYKNEAVEAWHEITSGIDLPAIQRTFGALFGYILTLLLDPATVDQLAPPLLDLLGVGEDDHDFLALNFLPAIRNAFSFLYWINVKGSNAI